VDLQARPPYSDRRAPKPCHLVEHIAHSALHDGGARRVEVPT
jgi:hypothetical protein